MSKLPIKVVSVCCIATAWLLTLAAVPVESGSKARLNQEPAVPLAQDSRAIFAKLKDKDRYWQTAEKETYRSIPDLIAQHRSEVAQSARYDRIMHGDPTNKEIAITFDDGPHPKFTPRILDILKQYNAKATFFVVGALAEKNPDLIRDEAAAGHAVGNHTYHHVNLTKIPQGYVASEIEACGDVLNDILHRKARLFRPPGGDYNAAVAQVAAAMHYTMVLWTDDPGDYANPGERVIYNRLMDNAANGGIMLIHDGVEQTIKVLPRVLTTLHRQGYKFVTVDQLVRDRAQSIASRAAARK